MRRNSVKARWAKGEATVNGWLAIPHSVSAEAMAHQGWDSLTVDLQHGLVDYQAAIGMFQAISTSPTMPFCRAPWNEPGVIMKLLDAGAYGVICPMVNDRKEAEALVAATRYPPLGARSFGPVRAGLYGGPDYFDGANDEVAVLAMIETRRGLDNLEEILATPGLDGVYVGPNDLGLALGFPPKLDRDEPELDAVIARIASAANDAGKVAGIHTGSVAYARAAITRGYKMVTVFSDLALMNAAGAETLKSMKGELKSAGGGY